jgi:4,5-dihydroxyphthalate decarboxylase
VRCTHRERCLYWHGPGHELGTFQHKGPTAVPNPLTVAVGNRFGSELLVNGSIRIEGVETEVTSAGPVPSPIFNAMVTTIPYDVGELALAHYILAKDRGVPLTALPIFPSRFFPQLGLTTHRDSGISKPADLIGKRVGAAAGLGSNPAVWLRSMLLHQHDVPWESMRWVTPQTDSLTGVDFPISRRFQVEKADNLQKMLEAGELDAIVGTGGGAPGDLTPRLFANPYEDIDVYVDKHGFFPINTVLCVKTDVAEQYKSAWPAFMKAFNEARSRYHAEIADSEGDHQSVDLGWLRSRDLMPDSNGLEPNRECIRTLISYCHEQSLINTLYKPEDLFIAV